ncbi:MAG: hypothetical protein HUK10_01400 [Bacteroides heparinolyticus]|nr:hypothetical protein [Bacteroides heparinolyticus]
MTVDKTFYSASFSITAPSEAGELTSLLKVLVELRSEFGITTDTISAVKGSMIIDKYKVSYPEAKEVIKGNMPESAFLERNRL